jgi:RNA polymerase sigma factor (sigma-70 family)
MARGTLATALRNLRTLLGAASAGETPDAQLLALFVSRRDDAVFAELVRRHGPMVHGVCRRVLGDDHNTEDAFQATFLILSRKATSIRSSEALGCWLHRVALNAAVRLRRDIVRRREQSATLSDFPQPDQDVTWAEVRQLLDEELTRLPERLRQPLILCYLQGKTRDEAAEELGWSASTFRGRLERGRQRLRWRLERRGVALSAGLLATLAAKNLDAAIPTTTATVRAAALATEVMRTMFLNKLKVALSLCALLVILGVGSGAVAYHALPTHVEGDALGHLETNLKPPPEEHKEADKPAPPPPLERKTDAPAAKLPKWAVARLGKPEKQTEFAYSTVAYSRDGKQIAWVTTVAGNPNSSVTVHVWDVANRKEIVRCQFAADTATASATVAFGPDGKTVALATRHEVALGAGKSMRHGVAQVHLFDAKTGKEILGFDTHRAAIGSEFRTLAFSTDGKTATTDHDMAVQVWDVETGKVLREFAFASEDDGGGFSYEIVSAGGEVFASCLNADPIRLWDVSKGKKIREIKDAGVPLALSADGTLLATAEKEEVVLWSVATGKETLRVKGTADSAKSAAFSPDQKHLAWTDKGNNAHITYIETGKDLGRLETEGGHLAFSPDGRTLASVASDGTVLVWEIPAKGR